jgi:hypothetical protein
LGWQICPPHLSDAFVIDMMMFRTIVEEARIMTLVREDDPANDVMPPHCRLIGQLHEYAKDNPTQLHVGEIALMVQYDGLLATNPHDAIDLLMAVTIGYYTMPIPRATAEVFNKAQRVEVVRTDTGGLVQRKGSKLSLGMLGKFFAPRGPRPRGVPKEKRRSFSDVRAVPRQRRDKRTGES